MKAVYFQLCTESESFQVQMLPTINQPEAILPALGARAITIKRERFCSMMSRNLIKMGLPSMRRVTVVMCNYQVSSGKICLLSHFQKAHFPVLTLLY
jgi:hypothetical protein